MNAPHTISSVRYFAPQAEAARFACLDLETRRPAEDDIQAVLDAWTHPSNWKLETIAQKRQEFEERVRDKSALLDAAPIVCCGIQIDGEACEFHSMGQVSGLSEIAGWTIEHCATEAEMLERMRVWLDERTDPGTELAGHNILGFDLPKLRGAYVRHGLALPECLRVRDLQPAFDSMRMFRFFSPEHKDNQFPSLDLVCHVFGLEPPKQFISGADVPDLYDAGRFAEIILYNIGDVMTETSVYQRMTA
ncbi:3'-5' exonuclease family protein [Imhoffiella purpurea]|uniref:Predicted 3'-5' exonuclease PolB-like domain-containing protein n=1 Tax=Imhoffiella purpurea TaxID=1249627 RepID=W9V2N7_9GAMM|nr:hypothetical protein [Imhoffiella purpurea]EXJ13594.1 hypothetical protein D779_3597 [Imhoffiella purpurea]